MNKIPILMLLAIIHTAFCIMYILNKKNKGLHDLVGCLWIFFICLATVRRSLQISYGEDTSFFFIKIIFYPLTYGPCLYLYTRIQTRNEIKWNNRNWLHFIPFFVFVFMSFFSSISFENYKMKVIENKLSSIVLILFSISSTASVLFYNLFSYRMIKAHSLNVLQKFSYLSIDNTLSWVNRFSLLFIFFLFLQLVILFYSNFSQQKIISQQVNGWLLLGFLYVLSFFFMRQDSIFFEVKDFEYSINKEKYGKSGLTDEKMESLSQSLLHYMETAKPYLKADLVISDIATEMKISGNHLSQVINTKFQKNFFVFINDYRVMEVISKMKDPAFEKFPVLRIAYKSGFNSKSSFNSIFRKVTGLTPSEFKRKN